MSPAAVTFGGSCLLLCAAALVLLVASVASLIKDLKR